MAKMDEVRAPAVDGAGVAGRPGSHPVGTGISAAAGGPAGTAIGAAAGPIGTAIGAVVGAVAGTLAGKGPAEYPAPPVPLSARIQELQQSLGLNIETLSRLSGFSPRSISGWKAGQVANDVAVRKFEELSRLAAALSRVMKSDFVPRWLQSPNPALDHLKPVEVIERGHIDRLWRLMVHLETGMPL